MMMKAHEMKNGKEVRGVVSWSGNKSSKSFKSTHFEKKDEAVSFADGSDDISVDGIHLLDLCALAADLVDQLSEDSGVGLNCAPE